MKQVTQFFLEGESPTLKRLGFFMNICNKFVILNNRVERKVFVVI